MSILFKRIQSLFQAGLNVVDIIVSYATGKKYRGLEKFRYMILLRILSNTNMEGSKAIEVAISHCSSKQEIDICSIYVTFRALYRL